MCDPAGGTAYAGLGAIVDGFDGGDGKTDEVDTSILSDKFKTKAGAQIDSGKVTYSIAYDPSDTATTQVLTTLFGNSNIAHWQIVYPSLGAGDTPAPDTFLGFVSGFKKTGKKDKLLTADVEVTISGSPGNALQEG